MTRYAGVVDEHVDAAEVRDCAFDQGPTIRLDANVATHRHRLGASRHTLRDHILQHVQAPGG